MRDCQTCIWYIYPLPTDNKLQTLPIPIVITETRFCVLGGCNGDMYEEKKKQ